MMRAGARGVQLGLYRFSFALPTEDLIWGICIDPATGKRYAAESLSRNPIALASVRVRAEGGKMPFIIYDEKGIGKFRNIARAAKSLAGLNGRNGTMVKFNTLDELVKHFGADPAEVRKTIDAYNKMVAEGVDTVFAKELERSGRRVEPISAKGPYYGALMSARWDDCPGGIHGAERLTACSMPDCCVTGMIAAEDCVKATKKNLA